MTAAELQAKALLVDMKTNNESYLAHAACLPQPKSLTDLWSREALLLDLFTECKPQQQQPQQRAPRSS